jgi:hypothetical protein
MTDQSSKLHDHQMVTAGANQNDVNVDNLAENVQQANEALMQFALPGETLEDAAIRIQATPDNTGADPAHRALNAAVAAHTSLDMEMQAAQATDVTPSQQEVNSRHLKDARDADYEAEVVRTARSRDISNEAAMAIVDRRIESEGEAAVLPQYTRIKVRLESDAEAARREAAAYPAGKTQTEFNEINTRVKAALDAGETPDWNDWNRLEEMAAESDD